VKAVLVVEGVTDPKK